jgi:23S rRNA (guanine2445-N2)-methyltransferase / 23S rRNA (guanine2069-N7)-methyltransferase
MNYSLFVSCPRGLEYLLETEVRALGLEVERVSPQGVYGQASLSVAYQLCLWSRLANRVQVILFSGHAANEQILYQLCLEFPWQTVLSPDKTIAIEFHGSSERIRNSMYGAQVVKDGIVDHFRKLQGIRPSVDKEHPQIRIHAHLKNDMLTVSFDLSGYSLHQRGYRTKAGIAPLKENIAAAMLIRAKWPQLAAEGYALQDPFCGAGTLVIEAALMAAHIAPGLLRQDQSLQYWAQHQPSLWEKLRGEALLAVKPLPVKFIGSDIDQNVIALAKENAEKAGVSALVSFTSIPIHALQKAESSKGLVVCNPPYGERLSASNELVSLYQQLGITLNAHFQGWEAAVLTTSPMLAKAIGLRAGKQYTLFNGALECKLYCFTLSLENTLKGSANPNHFSSGAKMFINRIKKNQDHLKKWAKKQGIDCYRVYDADLPEYAAAIDLYKDYAVLQEYAPPATIDVEKAEKRRLEMIQSLPLALDIPAEHVIVKQRQRQKGSAQYQKMDEKKEALIVQEGQAKLLVNLYDYLDTGLFLDHRPLRLRFASLTPESRFLNFYCYTGSASVHAALAGAHTTNVDLSNTYLSWATKNFALNSIDTAQHQFIQQDCLEWLRASREHFDTIFLDPPSFSNSKRTTETLDIQRDHVTLIEASMRLLNPGGTLYFSTNFRHFKLTESLFEKYTIIDISAQTIDIDFKRSKRIHQCFTICRRLE